MEKITINNVGPISEIDIKINHVNVFMGRQGSGKSTIAKIISYCMWVEKDVVICQSFEKYIGKDNSHFLEKLKEFHNLHGYFNEKSMIHYESDIIDLQFENNECKIDWKSNDAKYTYKRKKIEYIPSERNLITLPVRYMSNNNNYNFLLDWTSIRLQYKRKNPIKILNLPIAYYYRENAGFGENNITSVSSDTDYDILLENASSGLQSLTPLFLVIEHMTKSIYNEDNMSIDRRLSMNEGYKSLVDDLVLREYYKEEVINEDDRKKKIDKFNELLQIENADAISVYEAFKNVVNNIERTAITTLIIEEPEQNLFPSTQRDLMYHLLNSLNSDRNDVAVITTHSPYILYSLNNCMMGYLVNSQLHGEEKDDYLSENFLSKNSWIDPKLVSIWQIENGKLCSIQDKDNIISENYFDQIMTELTDEYYQMFSYYKDENDEE